MTLNNLLGISLETITPDPLTIKRLLESAERNITDSKLEALSNENRFDVAYKAIMQLSNAALQARGYRTLTSKTGHHQTMLQTLPKTVGISSDMVVTLDALRKQRNLTDYTGDLVTNVLVNECIAQAIELYGLVQAWLQQEHQDLIG